MSLSLQFKLTLICHTTWRISSIYAKRSLEENYWMPKRQLRNYSRMSLLSIITNREQECIPVGCVPSAAVAVCPGWGVSAQGGRVSTQGGCLPRGHLPGLGGMYISPTHPSRTEYLTDACENITFPQLRLRTVKTKYSSGIVEAQLTYLQTLLLPSNYTAVSHHTSISIAQNSHFFIRKYSKSCLTRSFVNESGVFQCDV